MEKNNEKLCDALLSRKGYEEIHAYGMQAGTMKTTKGNPDTYFKSKTGKYIFVAYTTQKDSLYEKAKEDIEKCLNPMKTGIQQEDIEEIIFCHTSSNLSAGEDKALSDTSGCKDYRRNIWEELIVLCHEEIWEKDIRCIIEKYSEGWYEEVEKEVFEFDKEFIVRGSGIFG